MGTNVTLLKTKKLQKKRTGIFLLYFQGRRLIDFPQASANVLNEENAHKA